MSQYDLFGDAAQVGGLRCLDAAVGGRAAERLPVEHEVVDAGFQVGAVDRLVLIVGVVEVDAQEPSRTIRNASPTGDIHVPAAFAMARAPLAL